MTTNFRSTITTIDCDGCPARGRHCADCFVPLLGRRWLDDPGARPEPGEQTGSLPLDSDELAAVATFVRCGLVDAAQASGLRAERSTLSTRAVG